MDGLRLQQQSLPLLLVEREWNSPNANVYMRCISHKFNKLLKHCWLRKAKQRLKKSKTHRVGSKSDKYFAEEKKWWLFTVLYLAVSYLTELRQIKWKTLEGSSCLYRCHLIYLQIDLTKRPSLLVKPLKCFSKSKYVWKIWTTVEQNRGKVKYDSLAG